MNRAGFADKQRSRFLAALLGASLLAGCQPGGTGSIAVDGKDPAVSSLKTFEDVKGAEDGQEQHEARSNEERAARWFPMTRTPRQRGVTRVPVSARGA